MMKKKMSRGGTGGSGSSGLVKLILGGFKWSKDGWNATTSKRKWGSWWRCRWCWWCCTYDAVAAIMIIYFKRPLFSSLYPVGTLVSGRVRTDCMDGVFFTHFRRLNPACGGRVFSFPSRFFFSSDSGIFARFHDATYYQETHLCWQFS